jgi:hypothetical protein
VQFTVNTDLGPNIGKSARQNIAWLSLKLKYHHALYVTRWATDTQQAARKFELWCLTCYAGTLASGARRDEVSISTALRDIRMKLAAA